MGFEPTMRPFQGSALNHLANGAYFTLKDELIYKCYLKIRSLCGLNVRFLLTAILESFKY